LGEVKIIYPLSQMKKLLNYIITHFKIQSSRPDSTEKGWEIKWTFLKIAFLKKKDK